jgi:hypothetical protein
METWIAISIPLITIYAYIIYSIKKRRDKGGRLPLNGTKSVIWTPQGKNNEVNVDFTEGVEVVYPKEKEFIQTSDTMESFIEIKKFNNPINTERLI